MKYSVFSVCLPEYDVPGSVELLKKLGYDGVEWRVCEPPPAEKPADYSFDWRYWTWNRSTVDIATIDTEAANIKAMCDAAGLEISALATYLTLWDLADIERVLFAAKAMDCRKILVDAPDYDEKDVLTIDYVFNDGSTHSITYYRTSDFYYVTEVGENTWFACSYTQFDDIINNLNQCLEEAA